MNFYPEPQTFDLRDEFHDSLFGTLIEPGIGQAVLLRRLRDQVCVCWDGITGSADAACRYCGGEGYLWEEDLKICYMARNFGGVQNPSNVISNQQNTAKWGISDENRAIAYFEYSVFPNYERYLIPQHPSYDKLYELKVDDNGNLVQPWVRTAKWSMKSVTPHRGDRGAIAMFECGLEKVTL